MINQMPTLCTLYKSYIIDNDFEPAVFIQYIDIH